jgi:precorrin-8X/cobalt-precorrin-8 methylmutase
MLQVFFPLFQCSTSATVPKIHPFGEPMPSLPKPMLNPAEIEALSLSIIEEEARRPAEFSDDEWTVVKRMIHTTADFDLAELTRFHSDALSAGKAALSSGATIITDTNMARCGIPLRRMEPLGCKVLCLMDDPFVMEEAARLGITRAHVAVDEGLKRHPDAVFVIGNAPTALLRLLEKIEAGEALPSLVVGMPVGFVNAAESKDLLMAQDKVAYVSIKGRKGGSALAACVVNALAQMLLDERQAP